jgi:hypothetical protein
MRLDRQRFNGNEDFHLMIKPPSLKSRLQPISRPVARLVFLIAPNRRFDLDYRTLTNFDENYMQ